MIKVNPKDIYEGLKNFYYARYPERSPQEFAEKQKEHLESLINFFEHLSKEERLRRLSEKSWRGTTLLFEAGADIESFRKVLNFYTTKKARLSALMEMDESNSSLLHWVAKDPVMLEEILALYPENERLQAVLTENRYGNIVLHLAASNPQSLKILLREVFAKYPQKIDEALKAKNKTGNTALHEAAHHSPEAFDVIFDLYPEKQRLNALMVKNEYGQTVFQLAAAHSPDALEKIRVLFPTKEAYREAIEGKDWKDSVLPYAARNSSSLEKIFNLYSKEGEFLNAVKEKAHLELAVLEAAVNDPESLKKLLALYPTQEARLEGIKLINIGMLSINLLHPQSLEVILALYPEKERLAVVRGTMPHRIALYYPELLKVILESLPKDQYLQALTNSNEKETVFKDALTNPESLTVIANILSEEDFFQAVMSLKGDKRTLEKIAYSWKSLKVIFNTLSEEHCLQVIETPSHDDGTLLHQTAFFPKSLKAIFDSLGQKVNGQKSRWLEVISAENREGETVLHQAAALSPKSLKVILENLPEEERLAALQNLTNDGQTVLDLALSYSRSNSLQVILESLPEDKRLEAVMTMRVRRITGKNVVQEQREALLHLAALNNQPTHLEVIFKSLSEEQRLMAIKEKDSKGNTVFRALQQASPNLINDIISYAVKKLEEKKYRQPEKIQFEIAKILQELESPELKKNPEIAFKVVQDTCALLNGSMTPDLYLTQAELIGRNPNQDMRTLGKAMIILGVLVTVVSAAILAVATFPLAAGIIVMAIAAAGLIATSGVIMATGMGFFVKGRNPFSKTSTAMENVAEIKADLTTPTPLNDLASREEISAAPV